MTETRAVVDFQHVMTYRNNMVFRSVDNFNRPAYHVQVHGVTFTRPFLIDAMEIIDEPHEAIQAAADRSKRSGELKTL